MSADFADELLASDEATERALAWIAANPDVAVDVWATSDDCEAWVDAQIEARHLDAELRRAEMHGHRHT